MSEAKRNWRNDLKVLRERVGGISEATKAYVKQQKSDLKAIRTAMAGGPHTVPEIAGQAKLPSDRVLWYVMALKRYGEVAEAGRAGDYYRYELKEVKS